MSLQCYQYKYNNKQYPEELCTGSFEECRQTKTCLPPDTSSSSSQGNSCFAVAQVSDIPLQNGTITREVSITSAGCWQDRTGTTCNSECTGHRQVSTRFLCCCTTDLCNYDLKLQYPVVAATSNVTNTTLAPIERQPPTGYGYPHFIVIFLVFTVATLLAVTYFRRRPFKFGRKTSTSNSMDTNGGQVEHNFQQSISANHNKANDLNAIELNEFKKNNNVAVLVPFRDSFDGNNQQPLGVSDGRPRLNDNNNNNYVQNCSPNNIRPTDVQRDAISLQQSNNQMHNKLIDLKDIDLLEVVGSGRFGRVHRALLSIKDMDNNCSDSTKPKQQRQTNRESRNLVDDTSTIEVVSDSNTHDTQDDAKEKNPRIQQKEIAVKVIPTREHQSWQNELEIYNSTRTKHQNVLNFFGWCISTDTSCHWLCIEYASRGSLHHFLKENTVNWGDFLSIASGIVRGLSHLHDSNVVHRDFKSKNVLLRQDLSPCITDFGVAAIMDTDIGSQQKKFLQVGTPRYMSPEILECSIVFGVKNFMKIDIYAAALVIWELLTRCYPLPIDWPDEGPTPYKLPFEEYIECDPDIDTMRSIVCKERLRPPLRPEWNIHPIEPVCRSLKESWEYDEDARVSATCFVERINRLYIDHQQHQAELVRQQRKQQQLHREQQQQQQQQGALATQSDNTENSNVTKGNES